MTFLLTSLSANTANLLSNSGAAVTISCLQDSLAPIARMDSASGPKNQPLYLAVLANDEDPDGTIDTSSIQITRIPIKGLLTIDNSTGIVKYMPFMNTCGTDSFRYKIKDEAGHTSNVATVYMYISCTNIAPVAKADHFTTSESTPVSFDLIDNDDLNDGPSERYELTKAPAHGSASITAYGLLTYTPDIYYHGPDSLIYMLCDKAVPELCDTAIVYITVTPVSSAPEANNDSVATAKNTPAQVLIFANDFDDDFIDKTTLSILTNPVRGTLQIDTLAGLVIYSPLHNTCGTDSFTYRMKDNEGLSSQVATVYVSVSCANLPPLASGDILFTEEGLTRSLDLAANDDPTDGPQAFYTLLSTTGHGSASLTADGLLTYSIGLGYTGRDTLVCKLCDAGLPEYCNTFNVYVVIDTLKSIPVAVNDTAIALGGHPITLNILQNDYDERTPLDPSSVEITQAFVNGSFGYNDDSTLTYLPANEASGIHRITYTVKNMYGKVSEPAIIFIKVIANIPPQLAELCGNTTGKDMPVDLYVLQGSKGPSIDPATVTLEGSGPAHGTLSSFNGLFYTYTPELGYTGMDTFYFSVRDTSGFLGDTAFVCIRVENENIHIPSAFTPNNDGTNEKWVIRGIDDYPDNEVTIFNKLGNSVFHQKGYKNDLAWTGERHDRGTYFYVVRLNNGQSYQGYVTLLK